MKVTAFEAFVHAQTRHIMSVEEIFYCPNNEEVSTLQHAALRIVFSDGTRIIVQSVFDDDTIHVPNFYLVK